MPGCPSTDADPDPDVGVPAPALGLVVVIPARDEEARVAGTVRAAAALPGVEAVLVVDDGSRDDTAAAARSAGAQVAAHPRSRGKAGALQTGVRTARHRGLGDRLLLFLDADLGDTARHAGVLVEPVRAGSADLAVAVLPSSGASAGGHGFVVALARDGIARAGGQRMRAPLSGQRCLTPRAFAAAEPLAHGWGIEAGMTIDVLRAGLRVHEVDVPFAHRVTGRDAAATLHRLRQWRDVARALAARGIRPGRGALPPSLRRGPS